MFRNHNEAKLNKNKKIQSDKRNTLAIEIILAIIAVLSFPNTLLSIIEKMPSTEHRCIIVVIDIVLCIILGIYYKKKWKNIKENDISMSDYIREQKINQINKVVFDSLYKTNSSKVREVCRYTYGKVLDWNPINYKKNVLVYDVHEQIRSIIKSIEETVINIDPERFNEKNVSVELVYCYPGDTGKVMLPYDIGQKQENKNFWKLISSGDTSGNQQSVLEHLSQRNSFFTLVDCCGTVYKNDKYSEITKDQEALIKERFRIWDKCPPSDNVFFVRDIRDTERLNGGKCKGTAIGTVINIRNDYPENIFVKAILTINTYGEPIFVKSSHYNDKGQEIDKFCLSEYDYEKIVFKTILDTYTKLLETELVQMYIRHLIQNKNISPKTGRKRIKLFTRNDSVHRV